VVNLKPSVTLVAMYTRSPVVRRLIWHYIYVTSIRRYHRVIVKAMVEETHAWKSSTFTSLG